MAGDVFQGGEHNTFFSWIDAVQMQEDVELRRGFIDVYVLVFSTIFASTNIHIYAHFAQSRSKCPSLSLALSIRHVSPDYHDRLRMVGVCLTKTAGALKPNLQNVTFKCRFSPLNHFTKAHGTAN